MQHFKYIKQLSVLFLTLIFTSPFAKASEKSPKDLYICQLEAAGLHPTQRGLQINFDQFHTTKETDQSVLDLALSGMIQQSGFYPNSLNFPRILNGDIIQLGIPVNLPFTEGDFRVVVEYKVRRGINGENNPGKVAIINSLHLIGDLKNGRPINASLEPFADNTIDDTLGPKSEFFYRVDIGARNSGLAMDNDINDRDLRKLREVTSKIQVYTKISGPILDRYFETIDILKRLRKLEQEDLTGITSYEELMGVVDHNLLSRSNRAFRSKPTSVTKVTLKTAKYKSSNGLMLSKSDREILALMAQGTGYNRSVNSSSIVGKTRFELTQPLQIDNKVDFRLVSQYDVDRPIVVDSDRAISQQRKAHLADLFVEFKKESGDVVRVPVRKKKLRSEEATYSGLVYYLDTSEVTDNSDFFIPPHIEESIITKAIEQTVYTEIEGNVLTKYFKLIAPILARGGSTTYEELHEIESLQAVETYGQFYTTYWASRAKNFQKNLLERGLTYRVVVGGVLLLAANGVHSLVTGESIDFRQLAGNVFHMPSSHPENGHHYSNENATPLSDSQLRALSHFNDYDYVKNVLIDGKKYPYIVHILHNVGIRLEPIPEANVTYPEFSPEQKEILVGTEDGSESFYFDVNPNSGVLTFDPVPDSVDDIDAVKAEEILNNVEN